MTNRKLLLLLKQSEQLVAFLHTEAAERLDGVRMGVQLASLVFIRLNVCVCMCECVLCVECKCGALTVWCSQAAPDVPQQSTVQKLLISQARCTAELFNVESHNTYEYERMHVHAYVKRHAYFLQRVDNISPAEINTLQGF